MPQPVLVAGARTPVGRLLGSLSSLPATALGGAAVRAALDRAGITGDQVDAVILGNVVQAGVGPNPARLAAAAGGIPMTVPAVTVNKLCLSGLTAIAQAAMQVASGYSEIVVAGGMESMSSAPHLLPGARAGYKYGAGQVEDALDKDALVCGFDGISMGAATERYQAGLGISRQDQDEFAAESHARAAAAIKEGRLAQEIVPVATVRGRKGDVTDGRRRGGPPRHHRAAPRRAARRLQQGRHDHRGLGVAAVRRRLRRGRHERRARRGTRPATWIAEIGAHGTVAGPDPSLLLQPANAIRDALRREARGRDGALGVGDLDLLEINEAFAGVALASARDLGASPDRVNVNGGAIAIGHPVGMSGARLVLTLALELRRRGGGTGAAALCGGGGQGDALILRVPRPRERPPRVALRWRARGDNG